MSDSRLPAPGHRRRRDASNRQHPLVFFPLPAPPPPSSSQNDEATESPPQMWDPISLGPLTVNRRFLDQIMAIISEADIADVEIEEPTPLRNIPTDHPNYKHCPLLYDNYPGYFPQGQSMPPFRGEPRSFPGVILRSHHDWELFNNSFTFYPAISAPEDLDDLFGNDYCKMNRIYTLCKPGDPDSLLFYSSEELIQTFLEYHDFIDPKDIKKRFNRLQINRLLFILENMEPNEALEQIVDEIQKVNSDRVALAERLSKEPGFKDCLQLILKAGMFMRGWDGEGPYPVTSIQTYGKKRNNVKIMETIWDLKTQLEGGLSKFTQLPMYAWIRGQLIPDSECPTLWERLERVLNPTRDDACIQLTSNIFCATGCYYLDKFSIESPFDLKSLGDLQ